MPSHAYAVRIATGTRAVTAASSTAANAASANASTGPFHSSSSSSTAAYARTSAASNPMRRRSTCCSRRAAKNSASANSAKSTLATSRLWFDVQTSPAAVAGANTGAYSSAATNDAASTRR